MFLIVVVRLNMNLHWVTVVLQWVSDGRPPGDSAAVELRVSYPVAIMQTTNVGVAHLHLLLHVGLNQIIHASLDLLLLICEQRIDK